jgi:hypothetical protein
MTFKKKHLFNFIGSGVMVAWLVTMSVLVKKTYFGPAPGLKMDQGEVSLGESDAWMAIYQGDEKIGFVRSSFEREPDGYKFFESAVMHLRAVGVVHRVSTEILGHLNRDTSLRSFVFVIESGMVRFQARGRVEENLLFLKSGFGGETTESKVSLRSPVFLVPSLRPYLSNQDLKVGVRYQLDLFDPSIMAQKSAAVEVLGREEVVIDGQAWDAYKVKTSFSGLETVAWIDTHGERLKEEGLMGLRMVKTTKEKARLGIQAEPATDLTEAVSIASNKNLKDPSRLAYLKVQLDGIVLKDLDLNSGRQRLTGSVLEINRQQTWPPDNAGQEEAAQYLKAGPFIQSDHPDIKTLSEAIVGEVDEDQVKVRRILTWVYENIEKRGTVSVPNALDTFKMKAGDCNEHAALFAALVRAAGIPARVSVGLVYARDRFYYHAWNEVFLSCWIAVDALMGQMPADVTHIKFVEGDLNRQAEIVRVFGRVKLKILDAG